MGTRIWEMSDPDKLTPEKERDILWRVIIIALLFKLAITLILPLGLDEAYAIAVAREYSLSFFDHPPISFWAPVAVADLLGFENRFVFRLPFLVTGVITTGLMYLIGREVGGNRAGVWSAILYAAAPFFLTSAGLMAVPDGTLNLGLALAVLYLMRAVKAGDRAPLKLWIWTGLGLALAMASKYQSAWLPLAVLLFMVLTPKGRRWFLQPGPWLGAAIGLIGFAPVVIWNYQNDWASFLFHTARAGGGLNPKNLTLMLLLQAIFLLPTGLYAGLRGFVPAIRQPKNEARFLLALIALGPILIFNYIYFTSTSSFAHWSMPGWMFTLPLGGAWLAAQSQNTLRRFLRWSLFWLILIWLPLLTLVIHANTGFLTRYIYDKAPDWDYTLSVYDFGDLEGELTKRGLWDETDLFMARSWAFAGIFDTALKAQKPMRVFNISSAHHFVYLSDATAKGQALYIEATTFKDSARSDARVLADAQTLDPEAELLEPIILTRGGQPYVHITLVRLRLD
jgi:4-amino-4-deoxy-L-arabinose transferase-like glycosyltransferase